MKSILLNLLLLTSWTGFAQSIDRIEPANWWVGMQHSRIQLLVYGKQISVLQPAIEKSSISLERIIKVSNPNYLFFIY